MFVWGGCSRVGCIMELMDSDCCLLLAGSTTEGKRVAISLA